MSEKKELEEANSPKSKSQAALFMTSSSPPIFISFDELMKASTSVANMTLAHEIAIDEDFKLQKYEPPNKSLEKIIRQTMMAAFWDLLRTEINMDPPEYTQALSLLKDVREEIKGLLLPTQDRIKAKIDEEIDLDLVKQQLENNTLDLRSYANFIIDMMGKLCAPVRDNDIALLKTVIDPVDLYREIFRVLELMKMDMANFTIAQMRPYIQQQSVTYERKKFQEYLDAQTKLNIDGLVATKSWLNKVYTNLHADNLQSSATSSKLSPSIILSKAYLLLLDWDQSQVFPECCVMDEGRLIAMGELIKKLLLVSTLFLVTSNYYKVSSNATTLKENLKSHCLALLSDVSFRQFSEKRESITDQIILDITRDSESHNIEYPIEKVKELRESLIQSFDTNHRVHKLLADKLSEFLSNSVLSNHRESMLIPQGFSVVHSEVIAACGQYMRIVAHNRNVFGPFYDDIIQSIMSQ